MKRRFLLFVLPCAISLLTASCLNNSEEELVTYNDAAITSFSLNSVKRLVHTTSKTGTDSSYVEKFNATKYTFSIDPIKREIFNVDSLPVGVDASKVLATIVTKNAGVLAIKDVKGDKVTFYTTKDSVDFTSPRQLVVYNNAGTSMVTYTVKVNIHKQKAEDFNWNQLVKADAPFAKLTAMKCLTTDRYIYIFGVEGNKGKVYASAIDDGKIWQEVQTNIVLPSNFYHNVVSMQNVLYVYTDGKLMQSTDAKLWTIVANVSLQQLLGASSNKLYASSKQGEIMVSVDKGKTWEADEMDEKTSLLLQHNVQFIALPSHYSKSMSQLLLLGEGATQTIILGKVEENTADSKRQLWTIYTTNNNANGILPNLHNLQVVKYGNRLLAMGSAMVAHTTEAQPFSKLYSSEDGGITWGENNKVTYPKNLSSSKVSFAMTVDAHNYLWIVCGKTGQVWKGRLNKLGWQKVQKVFTE